jgi:hypothetical protein
MDLLQEKLRFFAFFLGEGSGKKNGRAHRKMVNGPIGFVPLAKSKRTLGTSSILFVPFILVKQA